MVCVGVVGGGGVVDYGWWGAGGGWWGCGVLGLG